MTCRFVTNNRVKWKPLNMYELLPRFECKVKCDGAEPEKEFYKHPVSEGLTLQWFWSLPRTEDPIDKHFPLVLTILLIDAHTHSTTTWRPTLSGKTFSKQHLMAWNTTFYHLRHIWLQPVFILKVNESLMTSKDDV